MLQHATTAAVTQCCTVRTVTFHMKWISCKCVYFIRTDTIWRCSLTTASNAETVNNLYTKRKHLSTRCKSVLSRQPISMCVCFKRLLSARLRSQQKDDKAEWSWKLRIQTVLQKTLQVSSSGEAREGWQHCFHNSNDILWTADDYGTTTRDHASTVNWVTSTTTTKCFFCISVFCIVVALYIKILIKRHFLCSSILRGEKERENIV